MLIFMQVLSDSPGGLTRMKETRIEFFPTLFEQKHNAMAVPLGKKSSNRRMPLNLKAYGTALPINCTSIGGSRTLLVNEQKPLCSFVLGLVAWTEIPLRWVTERLSWKSNIQRHACRKASIFHYQCGFLIFSNNVVWECSNRINGILLFSPSDIIY